MCRQPLVTMRKCKLTPQDRVYWTIPSDDDALLVFLNNERQSGSVHRRCLCCCFCVSCLDHGRRFYWNALFDICTFPPGTDLRGLLQQEHRSWVMLVLLSLHIFLCLSDGIIRANHLTRTTCHQTTQYCSVTILSGRCCSS